MWIKGLVGFLAVLALAVGGGYTAWHMMLPKRPVIVSPILPDSELWKVMTAARAADNTGDHQQAVDLYTRALVIEPGPNVISDDLHAQRGSAYNYLGLSKQAYADYDLSLRDVDPAYVTRNTAMRFMGRGYAALSLTQYQRAKDDLDVVIKLVPKASNALAWRGAAHQGLGDRKRAVADYKAALELDPDNARAREELAVLEKD